MIETRLFRYFLAVAREENITKAAESLYLTQSTLSKQMMDLEQQLGKQLFIRGKRKITLTEEGICPITPELSVDLYIVTKKYQAFSPAAKAFLELIKQNTL